MEGGTKKKADAPEKANYTIRRRVGFSWRYVRPSTHIFAL
jgi:hypothetical protein